jgi:hypothetical protein
MTPYVHNTDIKLVTDTHIHTHVNTHTHSHTCTPTQGHASMSVSLREGAALQQQLSCVSTLTSPCCLLVLASWPRQGMLAYCSTPVTRCVCVCVHLSVCEFVRVCLWTGKACRLCMIESLGTRLFGAHKAFFRCNAGWFF